MTVQEEIQRRRTFAIISHPDAGKTTLTEKLLLFGGAIQVAGAVKSNKIKKSATSDFMEIEKQRGISVATSVMGFEYEGRKINILDTPGHKDFAEDTYRTLTAVDSVIVVIDVAKGVEEQTENLVKVCRMRKTPVMVFINKLDRFGKDAFDLLDEVEQKLGLNVRPLSWPMGMGTEFKGVYDMYSKNLHLFSPSRQSINEGIKIEDLSDARLDETVGETYANELREETELISGVYPEFEVDEYLAGDVSPVFFGSAMNNFGVKEMLDVFIQIAPSPTPTETDAGEVAPMDKDFSGFVFKIHANMDPKHRDRLAFIKICSGVFERNTNYLHVRNDKKIKFSSPTAFMASKKSIVETAYPGDIIGLHDTGTFKIGDSLTGGKKFNFKGIPSFSPEQFKFIENADPMKAKQLAKGIDQLMDEGVAQLFTNYYNRKIIGTVGQLQFEVIQYRLEHEYGAKCRWESFPMFKACWFKSDNEEQLKDFILRKQKYVATDKHGNNVYLAESRYSVSQAEDKYSDLKFYYTSEMRD